MSKYYILYSQCLFCKKISSWELTNLQPITRLLTFFNKINFGMSEKVCIFAFDFKTEIK